MSKKARRASRALHRSKAATAGRSALQRKAIRVIESERELEVRAAIGKIRAERDSTFHKANVAFDKAVDAARTERSEARQAAEKEFDEKRATILKTFAAEGVEVDAA